MKSLKFLLATALVLNTSSPSARAKSFDLYTVGGILSAGIVLAGGHYFCKIYEEKLGLKKIPLSLKKFLEAAKDAFKKYPTGYMGIANVILNAIILSKFDNALQRKETTENVKIALLGLAVLYPSFRLWHEKNFLNKENGEEEANDEKEAKNKITKTEESVFLQYLLNGLVLGAVGAKELARGYNKDHFLTQICKLFIFEFGFSFPILLEKKNQWKGN